MIILCTYKWALYHMCIAFNAFNHLARNWLEKLAT